MRGLSSTGSGRGLQPDHDQSDVQARSSPHRRPWRDARAASTDFLGEPLIIMIMPLLSVTFIGLTVGLAFVAARQMSILGAVAHSIAGAWAGFVGGALLGLVADITLNTGGALAVLGHYAAIGGAVAADARRS
jgi:hypothetical protein